MPDWRKAEQDIRERFGLSGTVGSGNQFNDIGDSVDNRNYQDSPFPLVIDSKSTDFKSYRAERDMLQDWWERATMIGKIFMLHIQFQWNEVGKTKPEPRQADWVLLKLDDFGEIYDTALQAKDVPEESYRTEEQKKAIKLMEILIQQITDPDIRLRYYNELDIIKSGLPKESPRV